MAQLNYSSANYNSESMILLIDVTVNEKWLNIRRQIFIKQKSEIFLFKKNNPLAPPVRFNGSIKTQYFQYHHVESNREGNKWSARPEIL